MSKRNVLVLDQAEGIWQEFLQEFFEETQANLICCATLDEAGEALVSGSVDVAFIHGESLIQPFAQKLKVHKASHQTFSFFIVGPMSDSGSDCDADDYFEELLPLLEFQKKLMSAISLPEIIKVLVVDDEVEIGGMIIDYFSNRQNPRLEVEYAENGEVGLQKINANQPDVVILDIKMPVKDGRAVYRSICERGLPIAVIVFFDAISAHETSSITKYGQPAIIEKGSNQSSPPELIHLVKKMAYFA